MNVNPRWRNQPHWVFAAAVYREKKDFQRNIDLGFKRGKKNTNEEGMSIYSLKDPYSVFQNVANTPTYHKKGKMEMMARLDNFGPFHVFFTLSCADYRWFENFTAFLHEHGIGIRCTIFSDQKETYEVQSGNGDWILMEEYMQNEMDESLHHILRRYVVTATRNYQARVQALMQTIVRNQSNPLCVKHFSSKLEFQGRGAGHNHGVLWLDINRIEQQVDTRQLNNKNIDDFNLEQDHPLKNPTEVLTNLDKVLTGSMPNNSIGFMPKGNKKTIHRTLRHLMKLARKEPSELNEMETQQLYDLKLIYPLYGLKTALHKLHKGMEPTQDEIDIVIQSTEHILYTMGD